MVNMKILDLPLKAKWYEMIESGNKKEEFFRPDGTRGDSPGCGSVLIAFGRENAEILRNCSLQGKYVELNNDK